KQMIEGNIDSQPDILLNTQDELAEVVKSFNNIALELVKTHQEINELNHRLKSENLRMSAELYVTHRIQEMILPKDSELKKIDDLDLAGFMLPANEVGGDYYDVMQHNGMIKIGMGDVTGHGLESGVLMIMVQTAVRTLLANDQTDPVKILTIVNKIIYENVQRMQSDKNLTLVLLDYIDEFLYISGQHEETIIVRNTGKVERIDTIDLGFPIGLDEDISHLIDSTKIKLDQGDVVVLYTDGITEAENMNKELYGLDRLINIVKENYDQKAEKIRKAVINDLHSHIGAQTIYDDITLLVIKKK
ncbi:MAG TPA: PP2C family protein-serine/threonine phosphatase, partial [Allocoleopsis sp.]